MDEYGNIFASKHQEVGEFHHSSLAAGEPVAAAGELAAKDGYITGITRKSGHYRPSAEMQDQAIQELGDKGVDVSKIKQEDGF
jgi:hypothetical protein